MEFIIKESELYALDEQGNKIAKVLFPLEKEGLYNIKSVFVDTSLRGQGVAALMMEAVYKHIKEEKKMTIATCPYAVTWFDRNKDKQDILQESDHPVVCEI